jgi:hypothetical protein
MFDISDKGGLGETRDVNLDISKFKEILINNKYKLFNLYNNQLILLD